MRFLKGETDDSMKGFLVSLPFFPHDEDFTAIRFLKTFDHFHQGCLARSVGAEQGGKLTVTDTQINPIYGLNRLKGLVDRFSSMTGSVRGGDVRM